MKKNSKKKSQTDEMLPEYDFSAKKGERGKYFQAYREGHEVRIRKEDGTFDIRHYSLKDGAIMLEPDVQRYFPDSDSVNNALRTLITLIPNKATKQPKAKSR